MLFFHLTRSSKEEGMKKKLLALFSCTLIANCGLTTSQFVTAPKPIEANSYLHKDRQSG